MEKKRGNQVMAIAALFIAVIGLSLGFAAFSNTLTIQSGATINPDSSNFDIDFTNTTTGTPLPNVTNGVVSVTNSSNLTVDHGTMINTGDGAPLVSGLSAEFTAPGQSVTFTFYTMNVGHLVGYLRQINIDSATGIVCEATTTNVDVDDRATAGLVTEACKDMRMVVSVDGVELTYSNKGPANTDANYHNSGRTDIYNHSIATSAFHTVTVTIAYDLDNSINSGAGNTVDGPVTVEFPAIQLVYKSVDGSAPAQP